MSELADKTISLLERLIGQQRDYNARLNAVELSVADIEHDLAEWREKRDNEERLRNGV
jgi:hypothetical protein